MLGHDGPPQNLWRENLLTGEPLAECPLRTILRHREERAALSEEIATHRSYFGLYENGTLLVAGGISDQPARYLDIMTMISETRSAVETKYLAIQRETIEQERGKAPAGGQDYG